MCKNTNEKKNNKPKDKKEGENMLNVRNDYNETKNTNKPTFTKANNSDVLNAIKNSNKKHKKMMEMLAK